jgi:zinc protease
MRTILFGLAFSAAVVAQQPAAIPPSYTDLKFPPLREVQLPKITEFTLADGMRVYLLEDHSLPLVRGTALVRTGNLFDPADKVGLAGVTGDTMRAGGTGSRTGDQLDEQLENIAASVESSIDESFGRVTFSTLKERTDEVLGVFHDVLTDPGFRQDRIDLIIRQLHGAVARRNDEPRGISQREFASAVYGAKTPYGWDMTDATLDRIKREDLVAFYKRYFFPANIILAVQGDFEAGEMRAKIEKTFAGWTVQQPVVPPFPRVDNTAAPGIYVATKADVTQTMFSIGHLSGTMRDKDYPALDVMADILGGGFKSRLFQTVRSKLGYAYEIDASWGAGFDHPGAFEIAGSTKSASTADTFDAIRKEVAKIRTEQVSAQELETAKQTVMNSFVFNFDTSAKTLNRLLTYRYYGYPDDFIFQYRANVDKVTRADILRVAKEYLDPAKFVFVAVGNPKDFGKPLSSLGLPVKDIDLNQAEAKPAAAGPEDSAAGKALLAKLASALGGTDKLVSVKDATQTATVQLDQTAGGLKITQTSQWLAPNHFRQDNILPFGKIATYSDGAKGWAAAPQGTTPIPPAQLAQVNFEVFRLLFRLPLGDDRVVSAAGSKLSVSDKEGRSVTLTLDPATGLPLSESYVAPGSGGTVVEEVYSDWKESSGIKTPRVITINQGGKHFADVTVTGVTFNSGLTAEQITRQP